jgi:hypothetical protein
MCSIDTSEELITLRRVYLVTSVLSSISLEKRDKWAENFWNGVLNSLQRNAFQEGKSLPY